MDKKLEKVIRLLHQSDSPVTARKLAAGMHVSQRTIHNYIRQINAFMPCIRSTNTGYLLDEQAFSRTEKEENYIPQSPEERITWLIQRLISSTTDQNIYDLAEELAVSESTIRADLKKVRRKASPFGLELVIQGDFFRIQGSEKKRRHFLSSILMAESAQTFQSLEHIDPIFEAADEQFIRDTVIACFSRHQYFINDYSLTSLVWHLAIAITRIREGMIYEQSFEPAGKSTQQDKRIAAEIAGELATRFRIDWPESEINELTIMIVSCTSPFGDSKTDKKDLEPYVDSNTLEIIHKIIADINASYEFNLDDDDIFVRFAIHIRNMIIRIHNHYYLHNPLTDSFRRSCPLIYDAAVIAANTIYRETGLQTSEDEITFMAFHIGTAVNVQKKLDSKIPVILFSPSYYDMSTRLAQRISSSFENELIMSKLLTHKDDLASVNDSALVISTAPLDRIPGKQMVFISPMFTEKDILQLKRTIQGIQMEKRCRMFKSYLSELITDELFTIDTRPLSRDQCIHGMCQEMVRREMVLPDFEKQVIERESFSSTAFGQFALPHSMKMEAPRTCLSVLISKTPIVWDEIHKVSLIILMAFNKNHRDIFNEIFQSLIQIISDAETFARILKTQNAEEFIAVCADRYRSMEEWNG